jgi:peptidoglycan hydrolase CwlO-like protein
MGKSVTARKPLVVVGSLAAGALLLSGCFGTIRAERSGKQAGEAICDVKTADNADDAQRQATQAQRKLQDLQRIVGRPINEDVGDINQQITDLVEHKRQGNSVLAQQDIAAIERNFHAVGRTLTGKARAAYDGVQEGLAECD